MKRRNFMLSALLAIPSAAMAKFSWLKTEKSKAGYLIRANESRFGGVQKKVGSDLLRCVVSCQDNNTGLLIGTTTAKSLAEKGYRHCISTRIRMRYYLSPRASF
jgi:hypothetical protein